MRALLRSYLGSPKEAVEVFRDALKERKYNSEVATRYGLVAALLRAADYPRAIPPRTSGSSPRFMQDSQFRENYATLG